MLRSEMGPGRPYVGDEFTHGRLWMCRICVQELGRKEAEDIESSCFRNEAR